MKHEGVSGASNFAGRHGGQVIPDLKAAGGPSEFDAYPCAIAVARICAASSGALVNTAYYGACSLIEEFMTAATELFSEKCLLQFEDVLNTIALWDRNLKTRWFEAGIACCS